jgi:RNA polymerase-binding transcription factor DksA
MITKDIQHFKTQLEKEKKLLESELATVGHKNPNNPQGWEATTEDLVIDSADENELADKMEELDGNELILGQLEKQLDEVTTALERIEKGTYGLCEVDGGPIEKERLEAIPSAKTCKQHMHHTK